MEGPESADPFALGLLPELVNCQLLATELFGEMRKGQQLNELMALHNVVLLDAVALGELLEIDERESRESGDVHGIWIEGV